jgi:dolichyl-phosphate-mannose--protein O-mannosyl transferase
MTAVTTADRAATPRRRWLDALERGAGWPATLAVTAVAALLRLPALDRPSVLVFDETYYVKDGWTLATLGFEARWPEEPNPAFEAGLYDSHLGTAAFVVHPPVGKWVIGAGMRLLGGDDRVGWRLGVALAGLLLVLLVVRVGRRLTGSTALGALAGLLVALDGLAIALSRTALLDGILAVLVVAAFGALLVDRDRAAATLLERLPPPVDVGGPPDPGAHAAAAAPVSPADPADPRAGLGPGLGLRPWRLLAGVLLGLAVGTKWSGLWFVAAFGLLSVGWDAAARYRAGIRRWWQGALLRDAPPAFASLVLLAAAVYTASWASWFATPGAYGRQWAAGLPGGNGVTDAVASWLHYHGQIWSFHTSLTADHAYRSYPIGWLVQWRPTSFLYESPEPAAAWCGAERCSQAVTSLGNPFVWWAGTAALVAAVGLLLLRRRAARPAVVVPLLVAVAAGWLPWFLYPERPVFTFYAIVILPFLALLVAWAVGALVAWAREDEVRARTTWTVLAVAAVLVVAAAVFFLPVWTGQVITFRGWQLRQWLPTWV